MKFYLIHKLMKVCSLFAQFFKVSFISKPDYP